MKKIAIAVIATTLALGWTSCKKKSPAPPADVFYPAGIHAKINGVAWTAQYVNMTSLTSNGNYNVEFDGPDSATNETISITLPNFSGKGVHNLTTTSVDKAYYSLDTNFSSVPVWATTGQVTITAITDTSMDGTFYFTAGSKTITEGTFNVNF